MKKFVLHKNILASLFILLSLFGVINISAQADSRDKNVTVHFHKDSLSNVLYFLMNRCDIAFGLEYSRLDAGHYDYEFEPNLYHPFPHHLRDEPPIASPVGTHPIILDFDNARLEDVVDSLVKQMKNYQWHIDDGVVNIFPAEGRDDRIVKLLALAIPKFSIKKPLFVASIRSKLMKLPELENPLTDTRIFVIKGEGDFVLSELSKEIELTDVTLKQLLNRATRIKRGGWVIRQCRPYLMEQCIEIQV
jgi:hypothetical protein